MQEERPQVETKPSAKAWYILIALSLCLHALIFIFFLPNIPTKGIQKFSQAQLFFKDKKSSKAVLTLDQKNEKKPDFARYLAEKDHTSSKEQHAPNLSLDPKNLSSRAENKIKANFLDAGQQSSDPLGIMIKPDNNIREAQAFSDYVPDVAQGDKSDINTWQWRHAEFFNRIKMGIARHWAPNIQMARFDPDGSLLGKLDRVTILMATIDNEGQLKSLSVSNSSGVFYLDDEAERALKRAAPFPFPPKALFKASDEFSFKFAFHLKQNRGVTLQFDWGKE